MARHPIRGPTFKPGTSIPIQKMQILGSNILFPILLSYSAICLILPISGASEYDMLFMDDRFQPRQVPRSVMAGEPSPYVGGRVDIKINADALPVFESGKTEEGESEAAEDDQESKKTEEEESKSSKDEAKNNPPYPPGVPESVPMFQVPAIVNPYATAPNIAGLGPATIGNDAFPSPFGILPPSSALAPSNPLQSPAGGPQSHMQFQPDIPQSSLSPSVNPYSAGPTPGQMDPASFSPNYPTSQHPEYTNAPSSMPQAGAIADPSNPLSDPGTSPASAAFQPRGAESSPAQTSSHPGGMNASPTSFQSGGVGSSPAQIPSQSGRMDSSPTQASSSQPGRMDSSPAQASSSQPGGAESSPAQAAFQSEGVGSSPAQTPSQPGRMDSSPTQASSSQPGRTESSPASPFQSNMAETSPNGADAPNRPASSISSPKSASRAERGSPSLEEGSGRMDDPGFTGEGKKNKMDEPEGEDNPNIEETSENCTVTASGAFICSGNGDSTTP